MIETLIIINIVMSSITPLILAVKHFIDRISKSECFGSKIELERSKNQNEK